MLRQQWLEHALGDLRGYFHKHGHDVPDNVRVSIGWPHGTRGKKGGADTIGQCWASIASSDKHYEIFIAPSQRDGARIVDILAHELIHVLAGHKAGHKGPFKQIAEAIGLTGAMTATIAGPAMVEFAKGVIAKRGAYPAGSLNHEKSGVKKQGTRLIKCECDACGYIVRTTQKWIDDAGAPHCGIKAHGRMTHEGTEGEE
jgi:hypothetical protein